VWRTPQRPARIYYSQRGRSTTTHLFCGQVAEPGDDSAIDPRHPCRPSGPEHRGAGAARAVSLLKHPTHLPLDESHTGARLFLVGIRGGGRARLDWFGYAHWFRGISVRHWLSRTLRSGRSWCPQIACAAACRRRVRRSRVGRALRAPEIQARGAPRTVRCRCRQLPWPSTGRVSTALSARRRCVHPHVQRHVRRRVHRPVCWYVCRRISVDLSARHLAGRSIRRWRRKVGSAVTRGTHDRRAAARIPFLLIGVVSLHLLQSRSTCRSAKSKQKGRT